MINAGQPKDLQGDTVFMSLKLKNSSGAGL